jgi:Zn-dependent peptidase ImmA (M78 family)/DNA-binding XRE family transcriptional regulator
MEKDTEKTIEHLVVPEQLVKARESLSLSRAEAADALGIDEALLVQWEQGAAEPSVEMLWEIADLYKRNTNYFVRVVAGLPDHLNFRMDNRKKLADLPASVREVIVRFEELCRAETELEEILHLQHAVLFQPARSASDPVELAALERHRLGLDSKPIRDVTGILRAQGIRVFMLPIPDIPAVELSGISYWHKTWGPCVLLNSRNSPGRRSFTGAHEYGHLLLSDSPTACGYMVELPEERSANKFATTFLIPAATVRVDFAEFVGPPGTIPEDTQLGKLASHYGVSLEAMALRLEELSLIPKGTTDSRRRAWEKKPAFYRGARGPRWQRQLGKEFISLALTAYSRGELSVNKLSGYFGIDVRSALEYARQSPGSPTKQEG